MYKKTPNAIRKYRLLHVPTLTQRELGLLVGMTQTRISKYELGVYLPSLEVAVAIALALRKPVEAVFYGVADRGLGRLQAPPLSKLDGIADEQPTHDDATRLPSPVGDRRRGEEKGKVRRDLSR